MAFISGLMGANGVQYVSTGAPGNPGAPVGGGGVGNLDPNTVVIDGTPVCVVIMALAAAAGLMALRWGGVRFNVGVSS